MTYLFQGQKGHCPHCKLNVAVAARARAQVSPGAASYQPSLYEADSYAGFTTVPSPDSYEVVVVACQHCQGHIVLLDHWVEGGDPDIPVLGERQMVYPKEMPRELPASAPEMVRSLYREASVCETAGALRAAGVLYRAATEEMVKDQGGTGRDLYAKIQSLAPKVDEELLKDLHESRVMGNDSIHDGVEYAAEEVADIAELLQEATLVLYEQPAQKARMRQARLDRHEVARGRSTAS